MTTTFRRARSGLYIPRGGGGGSAYAAAVMADSPIGYWRLGDPSGTVMTDSSGNAHHGIYVGSPTLGTTGLVTGDTDTAATFSSGKYGQVANGSWMNVAAFTVEAIVKPTSASGSQEIIGWQDSVSAGFCLLRLENDRVAAYIRRSSGSWAGPIQSAAGVVTAGGKLHTALTFASGTATLYVAGSSVGTLGSLTTLGSTGSKIGIGANGDNVGPETFTGVIDEAAFYGTALSSTRIAAHAALV